MITTRARIVVARLETWRRLIQVVLMAVVVSGLTLKPRFGTVAVMVVALVRLDAPLACWLTRRRATAEIHDDRIVVRRGGATHVLDRSELAGQRDLSDGVISLVLRARRATPPFYELVATHEVQVALAKLGLDNLARTPTPAVASVGRRDGALDRWAPFVPHGTAVAVVMMLVAVTEAPWLPGVVDVAPRSRELSAVLMAALLFGTLEVIRRGVLPRTGHTLFHDDRLTILRAKERVELAWPEIAAFDDGSQDYIRLDLRDGHTSPSLTISTPSEEDRTLALAQLEAHNIPRREG